MSGIYIHIPFCHSKCSYCDFYKTTELSSKPQLVSALIKELNQRNEFFNDEKIETIYFGGGTPSVLSEDEIRKILNEIRQLFNLAPDVEITFEANPDDLSQEYLKILLSAGINRLSIGIQSFFDNDLFKMGRRHNKTQAIKCVNDAKDAGFNNISIDLIYGLPGLSVERWLDNLRQAFLLPVNHISAYHLTYHKNTPFFNLREKGTIKEIPEEDSIKQFELLIEHAHKNDFNHYEISNFAKNGKISKHNSSYWFGEKYLGIGPSSHSFDRKTRQWNISDLNQYLKLVQQGTGYFENEILTETDNYNDFIITRLRTQWGISGDEIFKTFPDKLSFFKKSIKTYISSGHVKEENNRYTLSHAGLFISDKIMSSLMYVED